ncbi:MAG: hypothetical protein RR528_05405 [Angelakisella sp.]
MTDAKPFDFRSPEYKHAGLYKFTGNFTGSHAYTNGPITSFPNNFSMIVTAENTCLTQIVIFPYGEIWCETFTHDGSVQKDWFQIATATPSQELALPLAAAIGTLSGCQSTYCIDQFDHVTVTCNAYATSDITTDGVSGVEIATLPEGFRPASSEIVWLGNYVLKCVILQPGGQILAYSADGSTTISANTMICFCRNFRVA